MDFLGIIQNLFTVEVWVCIFGGTIAGIVIGALPGLSASMGVALLIPVTFGLSPVAGIAMLATVYTSAIYGGSITATLIHTPGTPSSAATAIDGFQMTKQGKAMKAIGVCTVSSMIGGTFSAIMLLVLSPLLAKISLFFSAPEYMFMAIFGLTIIGSLAGDNMAKGLISGLLGLFVGMIGLDYMIGIPRHTFGFISLESGIQLVPAMIGMFSVSQVLVSAEEIAQGKKLMIDNPEKLLTGKILPTKEEWKVMTPTLIRSSIIGVIIGILPGAGGDIGSWVSYNEAKRSAKKPELMGKGSIEGICASEAANNAVTGGAMIPLLTLGIPGSGTAALLLGGLMIHGLQPGYDLFSTSANITYAIIFGFLFANILMGIIGLSIVKQVVKICKVPMSILCPLIIVLSAIGAYAIQNSFFDVYIMAFFGILGYFMRKTGFGAAPLILGVILSSMVEANFRRCLVLSRDSNLLIYFLSRPVSVVIILLIILGLCTPLIVKRINSRMKNDIKTMDTETSR
jgi:putative tricarboxylic transport membrane protein